MTAKELFSNNPDFLESLSDEEVTRLLSPYFAVTRIDEAKRKAKTTKPEVTKLKSPKQNKTAALDARLKLLGL